jgi:predicted ATPase/DNA-binding SARP family transcriptional activator
MGLLKLTFFGSFQAALDGKSITSFRSARVQGLLVYLALADHKPHSRDMLAALFWPDEPDAIARKNLRQSLYQLRQVLGETGSRRSPFLLVTHSTVQFNPASDHSLDVEAFLAFLKDDQLDQALNLYQGDLLPGFTCDSQPFEEWLRLEQERLHRLALDALFELTARSLVQADYRTAQNLAQRQLALEPWREEAHRQLIQALALLGERSAAIAQYEACRAVLEDELGLEPSAETEALAAHIRNSRSELRGLPGLAPTLERQRLNIPFVGRSREHAALVKAYQQASKGDAQVVLLLGEAGIGKTRLAQNFTEWAAAQGADILRSRAFETSGRLSYQPVTQVLRPRLERENAPEDLLSDLWLTQLTRILPELRDRYPDLPEPTLEEATARQHLFEAITRLCQALAERSPLVIYIDDWHWADSASLDVLHYAALRWMEDRTPILVLLTLRQEVSAESHDLQTWLARLKHDAPCVQFDLKTFSAVETGQLIRALLEPEGEGDRKNIDSPENQLRLEGFSRWLFKETDGQPFFLVEMLKALVEEGTFRKDPDSGDWWVDWSKLDEQALESGTRVLPGVLDLIRGWLHRISPPAAELLAAAAILDQEASFDYLRRVAGLEETQMLSALDELLSRGLLLESDDTSPAPVRDVAYSFSHQKLREVVYSEAGAARRRILHRRAFESLQAGAAPAAELAHHALNAGLSVEAFRYSLAAGNEAMRLFAARVAVVHYETAWRLADQLAWPDVISGADRQGLYTSLGRAYELTEAWEQAQAAYQAMINYAQEIGVAAMQCLGLNHLATVYANGFKDPPQAITLLEQARAIAAQSGDQRGLAETEWNLSIATRMQHESQQARHHGEQALAIARELGHPQLMARCLNSLAYVHSLLRDWEMVDAYAGEARDLYAAAGDRVLEADSQRLVGWSQMYTGRPRESLATLQETFAFSRQIENLWGQAECAWRLAYTLLELGRYGEAFKLAQQAFIQARTVGQPPMVLQAQLTLGTVQRTVMALDSARETLMEALAETAEKNLTGYRDWPLAELCALHAVSGDWNQAHAYALQTLEFFKDETLLPMDSTGFYQTEALLRGGDGDLARAEVERLAKIVGENRRYRLSLLRSRALLARWDGDMDQAIAHLQSALALAREIGLPGEECSILGALGELYAVRGHQDQAHHHLEASAAILLNLGESLDQPEMRAGFLEQAGRS